MRSEIMPQLIPVSTYGLNISMKTTGTGTKPTITARRSTRALRVSPPGNFISERDHKNPGKAMISVITEDTPRPKTLMNKAFMAASPR